MAILPEGLVAILPEGLVVKLRSRREALGVQRSRAAADTSAVTPPRQINPGQACFVTVRAVNRSYRFVPTRDVREAIVYCLAVSLAKFRGRIAIHEFLWMSNHFHLVLTDVEGCLPDFMLRLDSLLSRSLNALRGTNGTNIEKGYNLVVAFGDDRLLEHCVYTLANPCSAHLVARSRHWKGVSSLKLEYGVPVRLSRPRRGLWAVPQAPAHQPESGAPKRASPGGRTTLPEVVDLVLERPAVHLDQTDTELRRHILDALDAREQALIEKRRSVGESVLGWKAVVKTSFWAVPRHTEEMFGTVPSFSADDAATRNGAARARRLFIATYRAAVQRFMKGERGVSFPSGTWLMKMRFGVTCCPLPAT